MKYKIVIWLPFSNLSFTQPNQTKFGYVVMIHSRQVMFDSDRFHFWRFRVMSLYELRNCKIYGFHSVTQVWFNQIKSNPIWMIISHKRQVKICCKDSLKAGQITWVWFNQIKPNLDMLLWSTKGRLNSILTDFACVIPAPL